MKMRLGTLFISSLVSSAIAVAAVSATAPAAQGCAIGKPTAASYSWDFKGEANAIFREVALETRQVMDQADRLMSLDVDPNVSRETQAQRAHV
jgi:hypothetical protein